MNTPMLKDYDWDQYYYEQQCLLQENLYFIHKLKNIQDGDILYSKKSKITKKSNKHDKVKENWHDHIVSDQWSDEEDD